MSHKRLDPDGKRICWLEGMLALSKFYRSYAGDYKLGKRGMKKARNETKRKAQILILDSL